MTLPDFLRQAPFGEILLAGSRIGLYHVVHSYNEGYSPEMIVGQFPTLGPAHVHKVIAFYLENKPEADAYIDGCRADLERQRATGHHPDWETLRQRLKTA